MLRTLKTPTRRRPLNWRLASKSLVLFVVIALVMAGCPNPITIQTSQPPDSPANPVTGSVPPESAVSGPEPLVVPLPNAKVEGALKDLPPNTTNVPYPSARSGKLSSICKQLLQDEKIVNKDCQFNGARVTTYAVPDQGAIFQMVSLKEQVNSQLALAGTASWEDKSLLVGGLSVYQPYVIGSTKVPPDDYVVLLQDLAGNQLQFELVPSSLKPASMGAWQLYALSAPLEMPRTLIESDEVCYSQQEFSACLTMALQGNDAQPSNAKLVFEAETNLKTRNQLPAATVVNAAGALASVIGAKYVESCGQALVENKPTACKPGLVAAGADEVEPSAYVTKTMSLRPPGMAKFVLQSSSEITTVIVGAAVVNVLEPDAVNVVDSTGKATTLTPGDYRLDIMYDSGSATWIFQFVRANGAAFYAPAYEVDLIQKLVAGQAEPGESDIVLESLCVRVCRKSGSEDACKSNRWHETYCLE